MTRLAYGLDDWEDRPVPRRGGPDRAGHRSRGGGHVPQRPAVGLPRRSATRSTSSRRVRRYYDFIDVDTDRYVIDGVPAPGDAVGARARPRAEPERGRLGQPADRLHARHRRRDGAGQRGRQRGPAAAVHQQPAAGLDATARPTITQPRHLLRRAAEPTTSSPARGRPSSTIPTGEGDDGADRSGPRRAGRARPASRSTRRSRDCCSRCASATSTCSSATR